MLFTIGSQIYGGNKFVIIMDIKALLLGFFIFLVIPQPVSAYLDPGFGSMVWQMIVAVGFGAAFAIKIYWQKIRNFFSRNKNDKSDE